MLDKYAIDPYEALSDVDILIRLFLFLQPVSMQDGPCLLFATDVEDD